MKTAYNIDTAQTQPTCWDALNRSAPVYRDLLPLPHAVVPQDEPLVFDFSATGEGCSPLRIYRRNDGRSVGGHRARAIEWLYHFAGALAPAQLTRLRAEIHPDDEPMPSLGAVHFRELGYALWESATFPALFDNYPADLCCTVSVAMDEAGIVVRPEVHFTRVGPEVITGPLEGLAFIDEALEQAQSRWERFCHESRHWLLDSGITNLEIKGSTTSVPRR